MTRIFNVFWIFLMPTVSLFGQITITLTSIPKSKHQGDPIFLAGNVNDWNPRDERYQFLKNKEGLPSLTFVPAENGEVLFKLTQGNWENVEGTKKGDVMANRSIHYEGKPLNLSLQIDGWEKQKKTIKHTASPQVSILSDSFDMPQLNTLRRIWIYLPKDYHTNAINYPVIYMQDGQNLFDVATSFSGEWKIDETMDSLSAIGYPMSIIVGVENGGKGRLNEYSPWINTKHGGGLGDEYIDFIVYSLKPYIDARFRTMPDPSHTGIMGSSMGGLISMYAGLQYPYVFGKIGAFSSSFWFSDQSYKMIDKTGVNKDSYFYMIAGEKEDETQVDDLKKMESKLEQAFIKKSNIVVKIDKNGQHNESFWAREFPNAYIWLFGNLKH